MSGRLAAFAAFLFLFGIPVISFGSGGTKTWRTSLGVFKMVYNFDFCAKTVQTMTSEMRKDFQKSSEKYQMRILPMRCDMIRFPNGAWMRGFPETGTLSQIVTRGNRVFLFFNGDDSGRKSFILEYTPTKPMIVKNPMPKNSCVSSLVKGRYLAVNRPCLDSVFHELLQFLNGKWKLVRHTFGHHDMGYANSGKKQGDTLLLGMDRGVWNVVYNIRTKKWARKRKPVSTSKKARQ